VTSAPTFDVAPPAPPGPAVLPPAVRARGVTKRYGSVHALAGLDIEIGKGEVFGLIGPNGAGKTTALRILAGLCRATSGVVEVDGLDVTANPGTSRQLTGYMPDFFGVYSAMTAAEYLAFYASCYRVPKRQRPKVVADLLALVRLEHKAGSEVDTLSRGMKQRLCLARALVHDPSVLLLDEPASGLDPRARAEMRELVAALGEMGKTVVLSSHILPELAEMCTSFGILHEGRIVASGPARAMFAGLATRTARAQVDGDLEAAACAARSLDGVISAERVGDSTLEIAYASSGAVGGPAGELDAVSLLSALVHAGVRVAEFRRDEGDLEDLFIRLTAPSEPGGPA
jgi:ABC-2 type transport system ATP-binding protein